MIGLAVLVAVWFLFPEVRPLLLTVLIVGGVLAAGFWVVVGIAHLIGRKP